MTRPRDREKPDFIGGPYHSLLPCPLSDVRNLPKVTVDTTSAGSNVRS